MDINNLADFEDAISKNDIFDNFNFNIENKDLKIFKLKSAWVQFSNCTFNCKALSINNIIKNDLILVFNNCTFNCDVSFNNCKIDTLKFLNTKNIKSLKVNGDSTDFEKKSEISSFWFSNIKGNKNEEKSDFEKNKEIILSASFSFFNVLFKKYFEFNNINNSNGIFSFSEIVIGNNEFKHVSSCVFHSSYLNNVRFCDNVFNTYTNFKNSTFSYNKNNFKDTGNHWNESKFERNEFNKVSFNDVQFIDFFKFEKCDFLSTTWFEKCKNIENTNLKFVACEFKGFVLYNYSTLNFLDIDRCTYDKSVSFTDAEFNSIKLFEVKFGGGAFFDEMKINKVLDKSYLNSKGIKILEWKRTLRAIKQELQKTENRIDFNRYRSYELAAHYEELNYKENFKDVAILWTTKISTDFGLNWRKAFWFTIKTGIGFYSVFYVIENFTNSIDISNWNNWTRLISGLFRFFLVTDFYNPLETDRVYLTNPLSWLVFIFGKIVIAFGIYEMIQSFRKFKA